MLWLIYGYKGWIGQQITRILENMGERVIEGQIRADHSNQLRDEIIAVRPDRIICAIGRTYGPGFPNIDYLEQPGKLSINLRDNLHAPLNLALIAQSLEIHLTYIGTGCIYEFNDQHPQSNYENNGYTENDQPNFIGSQYSIVKGITDQLISKIGNVLNARIRMPITNHIDPRSFIAKITRYEKVISIPNSMSVLPELLPLLMELSKKKIVGTINLTNPGAITHGEILDIYTKIVNPNFKYEIMGIQELNNYVLGQRSNNYLETKLLQSYFPNVKPIKQSIQNILTKTEND